MKVQLNNNKNAIMMSYVITPFIQYDNTYPRLTHLSPLCCISSAPTQLLRCVPVSKIQVLAASCYLGRLYLMYPEFAPTRS